MYLLTVKASAFSNSFPICVCIIYFSNVRKATFEFFYMRKYTLFILCANCNEITSVLRIVIIFQSVLFSLRYLILHIKIHIYLKIYFSRDAESSSPTMYPKKLNLILNEQHYKSCLPSRARERVTSSAYSRSLPTGIP